MIRTILHYPDKRLRDAGATVTAFDATLHALLDDMAETMRRGPGRRARRHADRRGAQVCVIDCADDGDESALIEFVNPEIVATEGEVAWPEGCLSFPGSRRRSTAEHEGPRAGPSRAVVRAQPTASAVAVQHEIDHLHGKPHDRPHGAAQEACRPLQDDARREPGRDLTAPVTSSRA